MHTNRDVSTPALRSGTSLASPDTMRLDLRGSDSKRPSAAPYACLTEKLTRTRLCKLH